MTSPHGQVAAQYFFANGSTGVGDPNISQVLISRRWTRISPFALQA
jgi:hypothetical protein